MSFRGQQKRLAAYEAYFLVKATFTISVAVAIALRVDAPPAGPFALLALLSALSVRFNTDGDAGGRLAASAQSMVIAAAIAYLPANSRVSGALLVGMAAAFWRIPRSRYQTFTILGNVASFGIPALCAALVSLTLPIGSGPSAFGLAAAAAPLALVYAVANSALTIPGVALVGEMPLRVAARGFRGVAVTGYVPFLFGAFVGSAALRLGLVILALAAATLIMVQAVFAAYRRLVTAQEGAIDGLVAAIEQKDPYTAGHSRRVQKYAGYISDELRVRGAARERLLEHAVMHDVGKFVVPNDILCKPGRLDPDEIVLMRRHEPAGAAILARVPSLRASATIASGKGERAGLDGPVRAEHIVHVADAYDAMTSTRAYGKAKAQDEVFAELRRCAGTQFHPACVDALIAQLERRGEKHGAGYEQDIVEYKTPPPERTLGRTLRDGDGPEPEPVPEPEQHDATRVSREHIAATMFGAAAIIAGIVAATVAATAPVAVPLALGALVAAGELVALRPLRGVARPLSLVISLTALATLTTTAAAVAIGAGILAATVGHRSPHTTARRLTVAAAMALTYTALAELGPGTAAIGTLLGALLATSAIGLVVAELVDTGRLQFAAENRVADLAILACGPLVAAGCTAGGLGLGALPIMLVPLALSVRGTQQSHEANATLFSWLDAVSLAPEIAGHAARGRAERIAAYSVGVAEQIGMDAELVDQLRAAALMESVGTCCLDAPQVLGRPHRAEEIVEASAGILKGTRHFYQAGEILWAALREPELATDHETDRAGQVLRVAIAFEDATDGIIDVDHVAQLIAVLRHSVVHPLDAELCAQLQHVVAPGTRPSAWTPLRTHATLTCGCIRVVDDYAFPGDDEPCPMHGDQTIATLAADHLRDLLDDPVATYQYAHALFEQPRPEPAELARELFEKLAPHTTDPTALAPIARAGYDTGETWERAVAHHCAEAGLPIEYAYALLAAAETDQIDVFEALRATYAATELDVVYGPVAA